MRESIRNYALALIAILALSYSVVSERLEMGRDVRRASTTAGAVAILRASLPTSRIEWEAGIEEIMAPNEFLDGALLPILLADTDGAERYNGFIPLDGLGEVYFFYSASNARDLSRHLANTVSCNSQVHSGTVEGQWPIDSNSIGNTTGPEFNFSLVVLDRALDERSGEDCRVSARTVVLSNEATRPRFEADYLSIMGEIASRWDLRSRESFLQYRELRERYLRQTVKVPGFDVEVPTNAAGLLLSSTSLVISLLLLFVTNGGSEHASMTSNEGSIQHLIAVLEVVFWNIVFIFGLLLPIIVVSVWRFMPLATDMPSFFVQILDALLSAGLGILTLAAMRWAFSKL